MNFVNTATIYTHEVKQSKFIAHLIPFSQYETTLKDLKLQHTKARHFVVAYRYLNEFNQTIEHSSDDGEPKGTSGKPTLFVLQGNELINTAVIIVRYFGGTKLGTGGLVRAYSDATNLVINESSLEVYQELITKKISFSYSLVRMVEYESIEYEIKIVEKNFNDIVEYIIKASNENMNNFLKKLNRDIKVL